MSGSKFQSKNTVLTKKLDNVIYELMVKTHADMVYVNDETTLTEKLYDISELLISQDKSYQELKRDYENLVKDADASFDSFKEIWDYININNNPKSELIKLIESKQTSEEGKGLSTCDFTDILREKLVNDYTREELDAKFAIIVEEAAPKDLINRVDALEKKPNILTLENASGDAYDSLVDNSCWFSIVSRDV